jgi:hypothetical protein
MNNVAKEIYQQTLVMDIDMKPSFLSNFSEDGSGSTSAYPTLPFYSPSGSKAELKPQPTSKGRTQAFMEQTQRIASLQEIVNGSKKITADLIMRQMTDR